jgi:sarcosine oxidase subunit alpha
MSGETVEIELDGARVSVTPGTTVAAAMLNAGASTFRTSVSGEPRGPLCGMGICFECRVTVDGAPHRRACLVVCSNGMRVDTGSAR